MSDGAWFIGSRRQYGVMNASEPLERLDPSDFRSPSSACLDPAKRREYELEVLERVIADIRDPETPE
jgi:hypothetical protein